MAKATGKKSDLSLVQEQLEVLQGESHHNHEMLHAIAKTQVAHGKILRELAKGMGQDNAALAAATGELEQHTTALQAAIDAQKT